MVKQPPLNIRNRKTEIKMRTYYINQRELEKCTVFDEYTGNPVRFEFFRLRFRFRARDPVRFAAGKPGNAIRGAFGNALRKIACSPDCADPDRCPLPGDCPYARIFEARMAGAGPSGLADRPRPFVFRAAQLDGRTIERDEEFGFDVHLFDLTDSGLPWFVRGFAEAGRQGMGVRRGVVELTAVDALDLDDSVLDRIFPDGAGADPLTPVGVDLAPTHSTLSRVCVRFVTPTELKGAQRVVDKPEFHVLFARIRDRLSTLGALYGRGPLKIDFRAAADRAAAIKMTRCEIIWASAKRHSGRTGQIHPLAGFTGIAEYEGDLAPFVPYLEAARWAGVGRHTVWGMGEIRAENTRNTLI
jgi:hypothetical protein